MPTNQDDSFEGRFWRPHDRHRSYGRVDYDHADGVRLHLVDTNLTDWSDGRPQSPQYVEVLHGESLGGQPLTVLGLHQTNWCYRGIGSNGGDIVDGFADVLLRGGHVDSADDVVAEHFGCTLHGLKEFLTGGTVDRRLLWPKADDGGRADTLAVTVGDGVELLLIAHRDRSVTRDEEHTKVWTSAGLTFDPPQPLPVVEREYINVLRDLVLFATRRQSYITSLSAKAQPGPGGSIEVMKRAYPRPRESADVYALALNLSEHAEPARIVAAWFELRRRIGPVWNVFFAALDRPESLLEDRLLGLLAFAEGYHRALHDDPPLTRSEDKAAKKAIKDALEDERIRRVFTQATAHANSQTQRERLEHLVRRALGVLNDMWYVDVDVFVSQLIHTRNWLVHWGKRQRHTVEEAVEMVEIVRSLIVVIYVNLLLDLGLDDEAARAVIGSGWRLEGLPDPPWPLNDDCVESRSHHESG